MSVKKDIATIEGHLEPLNHEAAGISFDNTGTDLTSDNVQDAISELGSSKENFSYKDIPTGKTVEIKDGQQMLVDGHVTVSGHLAVNGELVDISNRQNNQFFYDLIETDEVVEVDENRLLLYKDHLAVLGHLRVKGRLSGV